MLYESEHEEVLSQGLKQDEVEELDDEHEEEELDDDGQHSEEDVLDDEHEEEELEDDDELEDETDLLHEISKWHLFLLLLLFPHPSVVISGFVNSAFSANSLPAAFSKAKTLITKLRPLIKNILV